MNQRFWVAGLLVGGYLFGAVYDYYFLYGADATWQDRPSGWDSSGTTVIDKADQLRTAIAALR